MRTDPNRNLNAVREDQTDTEELDAGLERTGSEPRLEAEPEDIYERAPELEDVGIC